MANKVPAKIDIGPVYNVDPQRRKAFTGKRLTFARFCYAQWTWPHKFSQEK